jgi:hypothetical protein
MLDGATIVTASTLVAVDVIVVTPVCFTDTANVARPPANIQQQN